MYSLILKEFLIQKKNILFSIIYLFIITIAFQHVGSAVYSTAMVAFTYIFIMSACAYEEKYKTEVLYNSLPVSRKDLVIAKYLSVYVSVIFATIVYFIITSIIKVLDFGINVYPVTLEGFVGGVLAVTIITGIYLPVYFKVGYIKSKILNFILFFGFFFGIGAVGNIIRNLGNKQMANKYIEFFEGNSEIQIIITLLFAIIIIFSLSYTLSIKIYRKREF